MNKKKMLSFIPGFRSNKMYKKIIALLYYFFSIYTLFINRFDAFLFYISIPFIVFGLIDLITHNKKNISIKNPIMTLVISLSAFLISMLFPIPIK